MTDLMQEIETHVQGTRIEVWWPITHLGEYVAERYEASTMGRIRGLRRGGVLAPQMQPGSRTVSLPLGPGRRRTCTIHVLVLNTFIGPPPPGKEGCHNDGNPGNNELSNLRWDTHSENAKDMTRHGRNWMANKERCPRKHLLTMPNLVKWLLVKKGYRHCFSCVGAQRLNTRNRAKGLPEVDVQIESDRRYALVMANEVER